ncbi:Myb-like_DNA-binding domain-containing protein [Hexamita inflata]|uniref:Myb-like DNA-binding domain-containing protein n=1 Tax=Hexamita inflata TaxID=28002 RepID=A0AA86PST3_9EUKA|nr:Myb-like DNA-binding domain-containing protein [Hexamita inflata]CAI9965039.1 Myb-like DNA-binding domain-containing protein [Hexamita inflata]
MKVTRTEWTQEKIDKLIQVTKSYRESNKDVNWKIISEQMNMTCSQCRNYYQIVIKKQLQLESRKNHMWSKDEIMSLWGAMQNNNENLDTVQKQYFPTFTKKQLRGQYSSIIKRRKRFLDDYTSILANPAFIQTIDHNTFVTECCMIKNSCIKKILIDEGYPGLENAALTSQYEKMAFDQFWGNINPLDLQHIFQVEKKRRNVLEKEVDAVKII